MTLIHIVLFKFKTEVSQEHRIKCLHELKKLKMLPSVKEGRLFVGNPSLTRHTEWSKGFEIALVSYHNDLAALDEYQGSKEHHEFTSTYMWGYDADALSFDFEVDPKDEYMCTFGALPVLAGKIDGKETFILKKA